jgi:hypothetical protein
VADPSTITFASGALMVPGRVRTPPCVSVCGFASRETPSAQRQSAKTTGVGGEERAVTVEAKKVKGRKRHLLVDTQGSVLKTRVHSAKIQNVKTTSRAY